MKTIITILLLSISVTCFSQQQVIKVKFPCPELVSHDTSVLVQHIKQITRTIQECKTKFNFRRFRFEQVCKDIRSYTLDSVYYALDIFKTSHDSLKICERDSVICEGWEDVLTYYRKPLTPSIFHPSQNKIQNFIKL